jgi:cell division GTPase FtsZ
MTGLDIPILDIEDYDPELEEINDSVQDESGGALTYAIVGAGQGGGRIAKAFYDLGYKKTLAINTARSDLNGLDLPEEQKFLVDKNGEQGAGKDQAKAQAAIDRKEQEVFNKFREVFGDNVDRVLICLGVAGGSGGGTVNTLIRIAKKYFTYIGVEDVDSRVGVIASLPTAGEAASPTVAKNAYDRMSQLCKMAESGQIAPLIMVDNDKIKKLYPKLTVKRFWKTINNTVAGLFHVFNVLANQDSEYTTFDATDYDSIMKQSGCMIMGVTAVKEIESETAISNALKKNLEKTLLAEGFDLTTSTGAACIVVGGEEIFEETVGLMDSIEFGFDTLAALTGGAIIHRGIYEDANRDKLVAYTLVGGLKRPTKRIEGLKKFLKK